MRSYLRQLAHLILVAVLSGCKANTGQALRDGFCLDQSIVTMIIAPSYVRNIEQIQSIDFSPANPPYGHTGDDAFFDILRIRLSIMGDFGMEGAWHGALVVRKNWMEQDWSKIEVFYVVDETAASVLSRMTSLEMAKHLEPYPTR